MSESTQQVLSRVRKPRVHITYEVETEGATEVKELPFVVGVLGDFSGDSKKKQPALRDRKFVQIDRDNFNDVMTVTELTDLVAFLQSNYKLLEYEPTDYPMYSL